MTLWQLVRERYRRLREALRLDVFRLLQEWESLVRLLDAVATLLARHLENRDLLGYRSLDAVHQWS